jgi:hypothetical protein
MLRRFAVHFDDMALAIIIWMCTLPLVGFVLSLSLDQRSPGCCRGVVHRCDSHLLGYLQLEGLSRMTMTSSIYAPVKIGSVINQDFEVELIDHLATAIAQAGVRVDRLDVANFYVTLKHRPMAILTGPAGTGKAVLVECLAKMLASSGIQRQVVPGHAWYAGGQPANTVLIGIHSRMITEKLLYVIEEASQPENAQQVFVVGLTHISPAELLSFFTEIAYQMPHNRIMRPGMLTCQRLSPFHPTCS